MAGASIIKNGPYGLGKLCFEEVGRSACGRPPQHSWWGPGRPQGSPLRGKSARSGHPGRGVPTGFSAHHAVGNGPRAAAQDRTEIPNAGRRIRTTFPQACHCEAAGRGDRRECLWCNLLVRGSMLWSFPGDCHVGLRPPRNDVEIFGCSFYIKNPRPIRTGETLFRESRAVGLRPPLRENAARSGHPGRGVPTGFSAHHAVGNGLRAVPLPPPPT